MKHLTKSFIVIMVVLSIFASACGENPIDPQTAMDDTTPPTVAITVPASDAIVSENFVIKAEAQDTESGIMQLFFYIDGVKIGNNVMGMFGDTGLNTYNSDLITIADLADGAHTLSVVAYNVKSMTATNEISITVDKSVTPQTPVVSITSPVAGNVSNTISIAADASVVGSTITAVEFYVGTTQLGVADTSSPYTSANIDTTGYNNGDVLQLKAVAIAANGLSNSKTVTVTVLNATVDTTAPILSITSPSSEATVSGTIQIGASSNDPESGVSKVEFSFNGSLISTDTAFPYSSASIDTTQVANGSYSIQVKSFNGVDLTTTQTINVTVNNQSINEDLTLSLVNISDDYETSMAGTQYIDVSTPNIKWLNPIPVSGILSYKIEVWNADETGIIWSIQNVTGSLSEVQYGTIPAGAMQNHPTNQATTASPLSPNTSYVVNVVATDNPNTDFGNQVGIAHLWGVTSNFSINPSVRSAASTPYVMSRADYFALLASRRNK